MGLRFQRRLPLFPGVWLNFSKSGVSLSFGWPGATVNVGKRGVQGTVGIPGTGLSWRERLDRPRAPNVVPLPPARSPEIPATLYRRLEALGRKLDQEEDR